MFAALWSMGVSAQSVHPLLQRPAFNGNLIVFSYAGGVAAADEFMAFNMYSFAVL
jgi:hypothetical protein